MTNEQLWQVALGELELALSKVNFITWFKHTSILSFKEKKVIIRVPNAFTYTWLEKKYHKQILKVLQNLTGNEIKELTYKVETIKLPMKNTFFSQNKLEQNKPLPIIEKVASQKINGSGLNPKYTFENFVVGKGNELAHAASQAVVSELGKIYNPLFIYGGVGLGKTHLLQAIGHRVYSNLPSTKILYVTCEKFTNDFIHAIRSGKGKNFKDVYRGVDLLLIDDIQFMSGKEGTQEEFFHTFDTLHQTDRQIIISSDRPPKDIPVLEHRLLSRFQWGMIASISKPDLETRIAILESKCREKKYELDEKVINYVSTIIQDNVRELEGALNKIIAYCQLKNIPPTLENTKAVLSVTPRSRNKSSLTPRQIINTITDFYDININDIIGKCRKQKLVIPRQIIMYLLREELKSSYPAIGEELGGRDHTTAMYAHNKISQEIENDDRIRQDVDSIKQRLYNL